MQVRLDSQAPIEQGHSYLFRFQFPGYLYLTVSTQELGRILEKYLPMDVLEISTSSIVGDLNWLNITFTATGSIGPILIDRVDHWAKAIGDIIHGENLVKGIGAMRFAVAYEVEDLQDAEDIIGKEKSPWLRYIENAFKVGVGLAFLYVTVRLLSELNKLLGRSKERAI